MENSRKLVLKKISLRCQEPVGKTVMPGVIVFDLNELKNCDVEKLKHSFMFAYLSIHS